MFHPRWKAPDLVVVVLQRVSLHLLILKQRRRGGLSGMTDSPIRPAEGGASRRRCGKTRHATFPDLMETEENEEAGKQPLSPGLRTAHAIISHAPVSADTDTV